MSRSPLLCRVMAMVEEEVREEIADILAAGSLSAESLKQIGLLEAVAEYKSWLAAQVPREVC